jgi:hypothetical protein
LMNTKMTARSFSVIEEAVASTQLPVKTSPDQNWVLGTDTEIQV